MRIAFASLIVALTAGCGGSTQTPAIERVEMRLSGWTAVDIEVRSGGDGRYKMSKRTPPESSGSFAISPEQFGRLVARLQPFQRQAIPFTEKSAREFIDLKCPEGLPFVTDAGAIWVHWVGPTTNQHYLADLGCDSERNADRNKELLEIMRSLPVPLRE